MNPSEVSTTFPLTVSEEALPQLKRLIARKSEEGAFFRIGVKGGGCSGFEYILKLESIKKDSDLEEIFEGVLLVCDPKSAQFLQGSVLRYTGNLIGGGFKFENPNAQRSCGCGTSFTPKA